jgi:hypothetical protein
MVPWNCVDHVDYGRASTALRKHLFLARVQIATFGRIVVIKSWAAPHHGPTLDPVEKSRQIGIFRWKNVIFSNRFKPESLHSVQKKASHARPENVKNIFEIEFLWIEFGPQV